MPRVVCAISVVFALGLTSAPAAAQPLSPADLPPPPPAPAQNDDPPPRVVRKPSAEPMPSFLEAPVAATNRPDRDRVEPTNVDRPTPASATVPVSFDEPEPPAPRRPRATIALPDGAKPVSAERIERAEKNDPAGRKDDPVDDLLAKRARDKDGEKPRDRAARKLGDKLEGVLGERTEWFRSDHTFDNLVSPVSNPFLFEDPRSLTEIRPIFIYQRIPGGQPDFLGGNMSFFGTQLRVALTDRWSIVFNKIGGLWLNPDDRSPIAGDGGFAELWLGPKYTFVRNDAAGRVMAGGLTFQIPIGSKAVVQDTGTLSVVPYVSYAESFGKDWKFGGINVMATTGYALSTNKMRSDYFYASGHVDWNLGNFDRFYPLAELNYTLYTTNGSANPNIGSEGRDLINFGGQAKGNGMLSAAFGARAKLTEAAQMGAVFEIPIAGNRDLFRYRFTIDFILRY
ncbi:MAG TPA: hypothetical protein VMZ71_09500 [Gemmataceae bacterium]|nr:hypothetical protein [Gemmataceae bacterium]